MFNVYEKIWESIIDSEYTEKKGDDYYINIGKKGFKNIFENKKDLLHNAGLYTNDYDFVSISYEFLGNLLEFIKEDFRIIDCCIEEIVSDDEFFDGGKPVSKIDWVNVNDWSLRLESMGAEGIFNHRYDNIKETINWLKDPKLNETITGAELINETHDGQYQEYYEFELQQRDITEFSLILENKNRQNKYISKGGGTAEFTFKELKEDIMKIPLYAKIKECHIYFETSYVWCEWDNVDFDLIYDSNYQEDNFDRVYLSRNELYEKIISFCKNEGILYYDETEQIVANYQIDYYIPEGINEELHELLEEIEELKSKIKKQEKQINILKKNQKKKRNPLPKGLRHTIFKRDNYTCQECGISKNDGAILEVDHIVPISRGGTDDLENLQTLCKQCNREKSDLCY